MVELVAFEIELGAAEMAGQPLGEIKRTRPADIILQVVIELSLKTRIISRRVIGRFDREIPKWPRGSGPSRKLLGVCIATSFARKMHHEDTKITAEN
jgi:hypothetical protein